MRVLGMLSVRGRPVLGARRTTSVRIARVQATSAVRRSVHQLSYFLLVVGDVVSQLGLLESGRGHSLIARRARRRRVRTVEARLDQRLSRLARYHRLELPRCERVHVTGLARHEQHHLRPRQRRKLVSLKFNKFYMKRGFLTFMRF